jgi:predicted 3-demethylubiquinone-9 3-methyltransferase (glyoxalase superfamily)
MQAAKILAHLRFVGAAEEATALYTALLPDSAIDMFSRYRKAGFEVHDQQMESDIDCHHHRL